MATPPTPQHRPAGRIGVMIATPLQPSLVEQIAAQDAVTVLFEPRLLPPTRYPCDHRGRDGFVRDEPGRRRWQDMLAEAEVLFGIPGDSPAGLAYAVRCAPRLRWVQATSAGAAEQVAAAELSPAELDRVAVTTASGIHAGPLAEFTMLGLLALVKGLLGTLVDQRAARWTHHPVTDLAGQRLLLLGVGNVGREIARQAACLGVTVIGVDRTPGDPPPGVAELHPLTELPGLLPAADAVVTTLPATPQTTGLLDRQMLDRLRPTAVLINVGRGKVVDEDALTAALTEGRLAGAALEVFATEPLPATSPLWRLPNVIISPHTAALSVKENDRLVELFCDNLGRYRTGTRLRNEITPAPPDAGHAEQGR